MRVPEDRAALNALVAMATAPEIRPALAWLESELARLRRMARETVEPMALNRIVGEAKSISELLETIGDAPNEAARRANADSATEPAPSQTWPMG